MPSELGRFAEGFATSFGQAKERQRLRDVMQMEQERYEAQEKRAERQFGLDVLQFENTLREQDRAAGVQQQQLGLQERGVDIQEQQFGFEKEKFGVETELDKQRIELERKRDENAVKAEKNRQDYQNRTLDQQALGMLGQLEQIPKKLRKTYLTQLAPKLGIDPKSEEFKTVLDGLSGLDDEELKRVTGQLRSIFPALPPGQAAAFSMGVISGQMTLPEAMTAIGKIQMEQQRQKPAGKGGPKVPELDRRLFGGQLSQEPGGPAAAAEESAAEEEPSMMDAAGLRQKSTELLAEANQAARRGDTEFATRLESEGRELRQMAVDMEEFDPAAVEEREAAAITGKAAAEKRQPIHPGIVDLLGYQGAGTLSKGQAEKLGVFSDLVGPKDLSALRAKKAEVKQLIGRMDDLSASVKGREELVGITGSGLRFVDSLRSQLQGVANLFDQLTRGKEGDAARTAFMNNSIVKEAVAASGLAQESAVVRSKMIELAFDMAKANDDGRLSDQDFNRSLEQIGASASVEQLQATLGDLSERFRGDLISEIESTTGAKPLDLMNPEELVEFSEGVEDERVLRAIIVQQKRALGQMRRRKGG